MAHVSATIETWALSRRECLDHLAEAEVGRLMLSVNCLPVARPVHLELREQDLLAALGPDVDPSTVRNGNVVAIEVDGIASRPTSTWVVTVTGIAEEFLDRPSGDPNLERLGWAAEAGLPMMRLSLKHIDGQWTDYGAVHISSA